MLKGFGKIIWSKRSKLISPENAQREHIQTVSFSQFTIFRFHVDFDFDSYDYCFCCFFFFILPCKILNHFRIIFSVDRKKRNYIHSRIVGKKMYIVHCSLSLSFSFFVLILIPSLQWVNFANKITSIRFREGIYFYFTVTTIRFIYYCHVYKSYIFIVQPQKKKKYIATHPNRFICNESLWIFIA